MSGFEVIIMSGCLGLSGLRLGDIRVMSGRLGMRWAKIRSDLAQLSQASSWRVNGY